MRARMLLAMALVVLAAYAQTAPAGNLRDLSEQLDKLDADEFRAAIDKADACVRSRDFSCAETQLKKAAKVATGTKAKKTLADSQQRLANERQLVAQEEEQRRRAEAEREERRRIAEEREEREERRREREERRREREAREEQEERSASSSPMPSLNNFGGLDTINKIMRDGQRQIAAAQAARAEEQRRAREEERRRAAEEERERRRAAEDARERRRAAEDDRRRAAAEEERRRVAAEEERRQAAAERSRLMLAQAPSTSIQSQPASRAGDRTADTASRRPAAQAKPKVEWGPVQLEALAICRKGKVGWACHGPLDNEVLFDEPSLETALARQHCKNGEWAAGGPVIDGKQWDAYRCGHALGAGDWDITKRHSMITARRSYMCPKGEPGDGRCDVPYSGQDRR